MSCLLSYAKVSDIISDDIFQSVERKYTYRTQTLARLNILQYDSGFEL